MSEALPSARLQLFCTSFSAPGPIKEPVGVILSTCGATKAICGPRRVARLCGGDTVRQKAACRLLSTSAARSKLGPFASVAAGFLRLASEFFFFSRSRAHTCQRSCLHSQLRGISLEGKQSKLTWAHSVPGAFVVAGFFSCFFGGGGGGVDQQSWPEISLISKPGENHQQHQVGI